MITMKKTMNCPHCNAVVKIANLDKHISKVHPRLLPPEKKIPPTRRARNKVGYNWYDGWNIDGLLLELAGLQPHTIDQFSALEDIMAFMEQRLHAGYHSLVSDLSRTRKREQDGFDAKEELESILDQREPWVEDFFADIPLYYDVLGIDPSTSTHGIKEALELRHEISCFPEDLLSRVEEILTHEKKRKAYDTLIRLFKESMYALKARGVGEYDSNIRDWIGFDNAINIQWYIKRNHGGWFVLDQYGAPSLYKMLGLKQDATTEEIEKEVDAIDDLEWIQKTFRAVKEVLTDPILRWEYDLLLAFRKRKDEEEIPFQSKGLAHLWPPTEESARLLHEIIQYPGDLEDEMDDYRELMKDHSEWMDHLPPKRSFYEILDLSREGLSKSSREATREMRRRYRQLERTEEVNLAYSVLKNRDLKEDYDELVDKTPLVGSVLRLIEEGERELYTYDEDRMKSSIFGKMTKMFLEHLLDEDWDDEEDEDWDDDEDKDRER